LLWRLSRAVGLEPWLRESWSFPWTPLPYIKRAKHLGWLKGAMVTKTFNLPYLFNLAARPTFWFMESFALFLCDHGLLNYRCWRPLVMLRLKIRELAVEFTAELSPFYLGDCEPAQLQTYLNALTLIHQEGRFFQVSWVDYLLEPNCIDALRGLGGNFWPQPLGGNSPVPFYGNPVRDQSTQRDRLESYSPHKLNQRELLEG
jgi:hypothetical protein